MNLCQSTSKAIRSERIMSRNPEHKRDTVGTKPPRLPSEGRGHRFESCRVRQFSRESAQVQAQVAADSAFFTPSHLSLLDRLEAQRAHDARRRA